MYGLLATMRNEAPFVVEWIAYHQCIGFDHIVIFTNDCTDETEMILSRLAESGEITHIPHAPSPEESVAGKVASRAFDTRVFDADDWVMWLDADEFLNIHVGAGHVSDLVAAVGTHPGICLSWRIFGDSGNGDVPNGFLSEDFTCCAREGDLWQNVKTLFRNGSHILGFHQHKPIVDPSYWKTSPRFLGGAGHEMDANDHLQRAWEAGQKRGKIAESDAGWTLAQVNHYAVRTRKHFEAKAQRGRIAQANEGGRQRYTERYFQGLNRNEETDTSILRWQDSVRQRIVELERIVADIAPKDKAVESSMQAAKLYQDMHVSHQEELDSRRHSVAVLAGLIKDHLNPETAIDVGCGIGLLMKQLNDDGIATEGVEGNWLSSEAMVCDEAFYNKCDLEEPMALDRRYDLAISIEVAEHLAPDRARGFVADLCALADLVVFSAAIPGQGGKGHKNEQWQSYWADYFAQEGYDTFDIFRPTLLRDPSILPWYRQNVLIFAKANTDVAKEHIGYRIPIAAADMVVPEHHKKIVRRTRRALRKKLDAARRQLEA